MTQARAVHGIDDSPRGRLLSAAAQLFRDKGYERTTVRDIAAVVGIQSGSIFHHFKTKEEILFAVMEEVIHFNTERLRAAIAAEDRQQTSDLVDSLAVAANFEHIDSGSRIDGGMSVDRFDFKRIIAGVGCDVGRANVR